MAWPSPGAWPDLGRITADDRTVLLHIASGKTNKGIATALCKSVASVQARIYRLFARGRVSSRTALVVVALKLGWIELNEIEPEYVK